MVQRPAPFNNPIKLTDCDFKILIMTLMVTMMSAMRSWRWMRTWWCWQWWRQRWHGDEWGFTSDSRKSCSRKPHALQRRLGQGSIRWWWWSWSCWSLGMSSWCLWWQWWCKRSYHDNYDDHTLICWTFHDNAKMMTMAMTLMPIITNLRPWHVGALAWARSRSSKESPPSGTGFPSLPTCRSPWDQDMFSMEHPFSNSHPNSSHTIDHDINISTINQFQMLSWIKSDK